MSYNYMIHNDILKITVEDEREIAARKFGAAVGEEMARRLESASDAEKLREVGVLIIDCADGAELLARIPPRGGA